MSSLMESIGSAITPELTSSLGERFSIPGDTVQSALKTSSVAMLATLASRADDQGFLNRIHGVIAGSRVMAASATGASGSTISARAAEEFTSVLFSSHLAGVEASLAKSTGIPEAAASSILASAAPLVLGSLAAQVGAGHLDAVALGGGLAAELPRLKSFLPIGFIIPRFPVVSPAAAIAGRESKDPAGWLWPVLIVGALFVGGLIWYFSRAEAAITLPATPAPISSSAADPALGSFLTRKLVDGTQLNIPGDGIENKLVSFIEDSSRPVDKTTWFDFDRILFATGSPRLDPSSDQQLANVAAIMKAYPRVEIRLGGYTDNTGNAAANLKLSADRAADVMAELVKRGVDPSRMDSKGYGDQHPVADNGTEAGRAQNRRISLRVTEK